MNPDIKDKILNKIPFALVLTDLNNIIIEWFDNANELFLYSKEEIINKNINILFLQNIEKIISINKDTYEFKCIRKNKTEIDTEVYIKQIDDTKLWIFSNITEKKIIENVVNSYYDNVYQELDKLVYERTIQLEEINKNLEDKVIERTKQLTESLNFLEERNEQIMKDLEMARKVQLNIIPNEKKFPEREEIEFYGQYLAMEKVGGDLYDIIRVGKNAYGLLIADVSGHGISSALISTMLKVSFNSNTNWNVTPSETCSRVNLEFIKLLGDSNFYATVFYGIINLESGVLTYCNSGHPPPLLYREKTQEIFDLLPTNFFLGLNEKVKFTHKQMLLENNDKIILYTDGITETRNINSEFYDYNKLKEFVYKNGKLSAKEIVNQLIIDVNKFCKSEQQDDDRAVLCFHFKKKCVI